MQIINKKLVTIDLVRHNNFELFQFIQHDSNAFEFTVLEDGVAADFTNIGMILANYKRLDRGVISKTLYPDVNNKVLYELGSDEMEKAGYGDVELQFFSPDNLYRITTVRFKVYLTPSIGESFTESEDFTTLQELFIEVDRVKTETETAKTHAQTQGDYALGQGDYAKSQGDYALAQGNHAKTEGDRASINADLAQEKATQVANEASNLATLKTDVEQATTDANTATSTANEKAAFAQTQGDHAKTQGDYAKVQGDFAQGVGNSVLANEQSRITEETERAANENERINAETSRSNAEYNRVQSETARGLAEQTREQQEVARQTASATAVTNANNATQRANVAAISAESAAVDVVTQTNYAKAQGDYAKQVADENKTIWLSPVANFAAIATTYPTPAFGSKVITTDDQKEYRYGGSSWIWTGIYSSNGVTELQAKLADSNRQTANLIHGLQVLSSSQNSPVDFEIQGRTLISLGNSNLEGNKYYVLADKKTWLRAEGREGTLIKGVAKFQKSASVITKADYTNKVSNSVTENPHIAKFTHSSGGIDLNAMPSPSSTTASNGFPNEFNATLSNLTKLDGSLATTSYANNGKAVAHLFSFSIIEQIERKLGRIPADTVAGKVQWIKDNVQRLTANWHGWGSSVGGNGASLATWATSINDWMKTGASFASHTSGSVQRLQVAESTSIPNRIDSNGFIHYLAYTSQASDGVTPSQLNTDFVECEIELKTTAVLDTRPILTRVANFEGKVGGSLVENPHKAGWFNSITLQTPSGMTEYGSTTTYDKFTKLDGTVNSHTVIANGVMAQNSFSFDLIQEVERNIGRIPKATTAEKVQWLKDNVQTISTEWSGFGSSVGGSFATFANWHVGNSNWTTFFNTHSSGSVSKLTNTNSATLANYIDTNGFIHYLAYANASDGTTASTINTDYVELQISLKQGATLHDPLIPLYEIEAESYNKVLVDWSESDVLNRYPKVQSVQHLQNVAVIAEGENLLPPFSEWTLHANAVVKSPYELEHNANAQGQYSSVVIDVLPSTQYTISFSNPNSGTYYVEDATNGGNLISWINPSGSVTRTFTTNATTRKIRINWGIGGSNANGKYLITNPMLTLGNVAKPFVPRNPSALLFGGYERVVGVDM